MDRINLKIRKYYTVFLTSLQNQTAYKADLLAQNFFFALLLFIFINLWGRIFADRNSFSGYSKNDLIWYFIITEIITLSTQNYFRNISDQIRGGAFAYSLNKPYRFIMYTFWENAGVMVYKLFTNSAIGIVLGVIFAGLPGSATLIFSPLIFSCVIIGIILNCLIHTCIALTALFVEDNTAFFWIYQKMVLIFGIFIPIDIFPTWLFDVLKYMPFAYITFGPAKLFLDFSLWNYIRTLTGQISYLVLAIGLSSLLFIKGAKHVSIQGG
jgi:ABC-2 type transport system permease protein